MTKVLEQLAKTRKGISSARQLGPEERIFGGKGILVRYKPNLTDDSPEKSNHDPDLSERQVPDGAGILDDEVE